MQVSPCLLRYSRHQRNNVIQHPSMLKGAMHRYFPCGGLYRALLLKLFICPKINSRPGLQFRSAPE